MELNQDWQQLQSFFAQKGLEMLDLEHSEAKTRPIYLVCNQGFVLEAFSEGQDLSQWIGSSVGDFRQSFQEQVIYILGQDVVDSMVSSSLIEPHLGAQVDQWRREAWEHAGISLRGKERESIRGKRDLEFLKEAFFEKKHFLLEAVQDSWWLRVLPASFGLLVRLSSGADFLLVYRKERLEQFGVPDLSFLSEERRKDHGAVVKAISERLSIPVQALVVSQEDWLRWSGSSQPWADLARSIQARQSQLVPFRWGLVSLVALRGFIGF